jgi:hypothetical protein
MSFITTKLSGRLGNNVFQIMTAMAHAWRNGVEYKIPSYTKSKYTKKTPFDFFPLLTPEDEAKIEVEHRQDGWTYEPIPFKPNMRLHGWYQNLNYFDEYRKELIEAFNLPKEKIDAVCVHVRRGDYARYPTKWPMLPHQYYQLAINTIEFDKSYLPIHVFSDEDISTEWPCCKYFIGGDPLEGWLRMTQYKYFIIANSTYSWTAAYLSGSDNVIAPHFSKWYGKDNQHIFTGELIPKQWIEIMF